MDLTDHHPAWVQQGESSQRPGHALVFMKIVQTEKHQKEPSNQRIFSSSATLRSSIQLDSRKIHTQPRRKDSWEGAPRQDHELSSCAKVSSLTFFKVGEAQGSSFQCYTCKSQLSNSKCLTSKVECGDKGTCKTDVIRVRIHSLTLMAAHGCITELSHHPNQKILTGFIPPLTETDGNLGPPESYKLAKPDLTALSNHVFHTFIKLQLKAGYPFFGNITVTRSCEEECEPSNGIGASKPKSCCYTDLCTDDTRATGGARGSSAALGLLALVVVGTVLQCSL
ncbi:hypothetical protein WISP_37374 [Willisornis vidua]|uniref:UPAR/Ly6 domain-containing protein n=1 Tax=Willisornis vidua TaxID=1566151 RepID=A0ABQ9DI87_9PASS|nr:hypothetical protein WISP_37374 [Willisornis vidua]